MCIKLGKVIVGKFIDVCWVVFLCDFINFYVFEEGIMIFILEMMILRLNKMKLFKVTEL